MTIHCLGCYWDSFPNLMHKHLRLTHASYNTIIQLTWLFHPQQHSRTCRGHLEQLQGVWLDPCGNCIHVLFHPNPHHGLWFGSLRHQSPGLRPQILAKTSHIQNSNSCTTISHTTSCKDYWRLLFWWFQGNPLLHLQCSDDGIMPL